MRFIICIENNSAEWGAAECLEIDASTIASTDNWTDIALCWIFCFKTFTTIFFRNSESHKKRNFEGQTKNANAQQSAQQGQFLVAWAERDQKYTLMTLIIAGWTHEHTRNAPSVQLVQRYYLNNEEKTHWNSSRAIFAKILNAVDGEKWSRLQWDACNHCILCATENTSRMLHEIASLADYNCIMDFLLPQIISFFLFDIGFVSRSEVLRKAPIIDCGWALSLNVKTQPSVPTLNSNTKYVLVWAKRNVLKYLSWNISNCEITDLLSLCWQWCMSRIDARRM